MGSNIKFCSICMKNVKIKRETREEDVEVRGVNVHVCLTYLIDSEGHELYDYDNETANSEIVDRAYRKAVNLLTVEEIKEIRAEYSLSAELFAKVLGMGLKSITRLENGYVQSRETNALLTLVKDPKNFEGIFQHNKNRLSEKEIEKCEAGIKKAKLLLYPVLKWIISQDVTRQTWAVAQQNSNGLVLGGIRA